MDIIAMDGRPTSPSQDIRPLRDLIRSSLLEYHDCLRLELPALARLAASGNVSHEEPQELLHSLCDELGQDMSQEEDFLFPAILRCEEAVATGFEPSIKASTAVLGGITKVNRAHERLAFLFRRLRKQPDRAVHPQLEDLEVRFQAHHQLQREKLFPHALQLIQRVSK